jgi:beta-glucanase (GH16 family)
MKTIYKSIFYLLIILGMNGCQEDEPKLETLLVPTNLEINAQVFDDESGNVTVTTTADNALTIHVVFKENAEPVVVGPGEPAQFQYIRSGDYAQIITVIAYGPGGIASSKTISIDLSVRLIIDPDILKKIAGDGSKRWVWNKEEEGHWGADAAFNDQNDGYKAPPNTLNPCAYDDVLIFGYDANDTYSYEMELGENNETLVGWADVQYFFPNSTPVQYVDECHDITNTNPKIETDTGFLIFRGEDGELYLQVENSTLSFWSGAQVYKILELTDDLLSVRGDHKPILEDIEIAYYHEFRPEDYDPNQDDDFTELVWQDEFDTDGAPDVEKWNYDIGKGNNGWGNNESQYYTDRSENVTVSDGTLKITAKKESYEGAEYTSARMKTQDKYDFTYGRVDVKAKLAGGGGTWPAIWMLGSNISTVGWPKCGEMDIMEYVGNNPGTVQSAIHTPSSSGNTVNVKSSPITNETSEFHVYSVIWSGDQISFLIDDERFYTYKPETLDQSTWPFDASQFLILNVAMGGNLGGSIDPDFSESVMEIDYVRVYQ